MNDTLREAVGDDEFYTAMLDRQSGLGELTDAGWFDERLADGSRPAWRTRQWWTPTARLDLRDGSANVILVTSGAFDPLHSGHLAMLSAAAADARSRGEHVTGGYLCPDHDSYVRAKHPHAACGQLRVAAAQHQVAGTWVQVDTWPACGATNKVNFTTILSRLRAVIQARLGERVGEVTATGGTVEWRYVYGSDNAGFGAAFEHAPGWASAACVTRAGSGRPAASARARVIDGDDTSSSTSERSRGAFTAVPGFAPGVYVVRDDLSRALRRLHLPAAAVGRFRAQLLEALAVAVGGRELVVVDDDTYQSAMGELRERGPVISIDPWAPGDRNLGISRHWAPGSGQWSGETWGARPGAPDPAVQVCRIGAGEWILADDDVGTGGTMRYARQLFGEHVAVVDQVSLLSQAGPVSDVVDARDFCVIAEQCGLVVGDAMRAPYIDPAVSLAARATLIPDRVDEFRRRVLDANAELAGDLRLARCDPSVIRFYTGSGYTPGWRVADLCHDLV